MIVKLDWKLKLICCHKAADSGSGKWGGVWGGIGKDPSAAHCIIANDVEQTIFVGSGSAV